MIAWGFLVLNALICVGGYMSGVPIWFASGLFLACLMVEIGLIRGQ